MYTPLANYLNNCKWVWCYGIGDDGVLKIFIVDNISYEIANKLLQNKFPWLTNVRLGRVLNPSANSILNRREEPRYHYL